MPFYMCLTGNGDVPHRERGCDSLGMHKLTGNGDVPHREWRSQGKRMCLTGNAYTVYRVFQAL